MSLGSTECEIDVVVLDSHNVKDCQLSPSSEVELSVVDEDGHSSLSRPLSLFFSFTNSFAFRCMNADVVTRVFCSFIYYRGRLCIND